MEWPKITWLITFSSNYNDWSKPAGMTREAGEEQPASAAAARRLVPAGPAPHSLFAPIYSFFLSPHPIVWYLLP